MMYEFAPQTLAGLDGLEALFGLGGCCAPGQTSGCDTSCQTTEKISFGGGNGGGSGGGGAGGGVDGSGGVGLSPCPPGLVDPNLVDLFGGPCTLGPDGTFYYGGVAAGSIPPSMVPHGSAPVPPKQPTSIWPVVLIAGLFLFLVKR